MPFSGPQINFTRQARKSLVLWFVLYFVFMQPVLAYLTTPHISHDSDGAIQLSICTLEGVNSVFLDLSDGLQQEEACPALKLHQMMGGLQAVEALRSPVMVFYSAFLLGQTVDHQHHSQYFSAYSTRAPPLV